MSSTLQRTNAHGAMTLKTIKRQRKLTWYRINLFRSWRSAKGKWFRSLENACSFCAPLLDHFPPPPPPARLSRFLKYKTMNRPWTSSLCPNNPFHVHFPLFLFLLSPPPHPPFFSDQSLSVHNPFPCSLAAERKRYSWCAGLWPWGKKKDSAKKKKNRLFGASDVDHPSTRKLFFFTCLHMLQFKSLPREQYILTPIYTLISTSNAPQ